MENLKDIWFVDDDEIFRLIIKGLMDNTEYGNRAVYFDDGDRAIMKLIELSQSGNPEPKIVFLDLNMKHLEGWQLIDLMNELGTTAKVVILTSSIGLKDRVRAEKEPMVIGFLTKPVSKSQILEYINGLAD